MENDLAYRLLRLEQRLASYEQLHAQELGDMREELDTLRRQVVLGTLRHLKTLSVEIDTIACNGCGQCVAVCLHGMFELKASDGRQITRLVTHPEDDRRRACLECQVGTLPCVTACAPGAIKLRYDTGG